MKVPKYRSPIREPWVSNFYRFSKPGLCVGCGVYWLVVRRVISKKEYSQTWAYQKIGAAPEGLKILYLDFCVICLPKDKR